MEHAWRQLLVELMRPGTHRLLSVPGTAAPPPPPLEYVGLGHGGFYCTRCLSRVDREGRLSYTEEEASK